MLRRMGVFILVLLFSMSGCVTTEGTKSFEQARELAGMNRFEEAIALYEDAVRLEPDNQEYRAGLKKAKELVVGKTIEKARSFLDAKPMTFDQLKKAQSEADRALKLSPESEEAARLTVQIKSEMDVLNKKAEALYSAASRAMETNDWAAAIGKLREIKSFYPNYLDLPIKLGMAESNSAAYYIKEADKFRATEDWDNVVKTLILAQEVQPRNTDIAARIKEAQDRHSPDYYLSRAEDAAKKSDWPLAMGFINKAMALNPKGAAVQKLEQLQKDSVSFFTTKAEENLSAQHLYGAYTNMMSALELRPQIRRDQKTVEFLQQLTAGIAAKADMYEANGQLGNALVWYEKALKLSSGNRELSSKAQALKDRIKQRVVKKIAIMDFTPPSNNPDAGRVMTDSLLSYLTKNSTGDVKILARDVLGALLKEIEMGQAGLYDIESAKKAGKLKGTDVFIFGSVLHFNVEKNVDEGFKVVNAKVGKKSVQNQAYQNWLATHSRPTDEELQTAPPQTIDEEIFERVKYKVANHKKTASVNVSFRVIDVEEGEVVITKTLKNKKEAEDTYSEGVEFANIPYKALKMPSDTELLEQVVEASVAELGYEVLKRFQNLQGLYLNSAQLLRKKGELERAVEKYVDAIHVEEIKNTSSPVSENARKEVELLLKTLAL